jgi:hypothetical protein
LALSLDGHTLATADREGAIRFWTAGPAAAVSSPQTETERLSIIRMVW